jgi:hypothetical protein
MLSKVRTTLVVIARQRSLANDGMLKSSVSRCPVSMPKPAVAPPELMGSTTRSSFDDIGRFDGTRGCKATKIEGPASSSHAQNS